MQGYSSTAAGQSCCGAGVLLSPWLLKQQHLCSPMSSDMLLELGIRLLLAIVFAAEQHVSPRVRSIQEEEWWLYHNRPSAPYIPSWWVVITVTAVTPAILVLLTRRWSPSSSPSQLDAVDSPGDCNGLASSSSARGETSPALLGYSLSLLLTGVLTDAVKLLVGRPRPDFLYRCFPDFNAGSATTTEEASMPQGDCTGDLDAVTEGRKSFPSGHASMSFASLAYLSLYLAAHLRPCSGGGRGWQLLVSLAPCLLASGVGLSRIVDFHHHAEDVLAGSLLGCAVALACYRAYHRTGWAGYSPADCPTAVFAGPRFQPTASNARRIEI